MISKKIPMEIHSYYAGLRRDEDITMKHANQSVYVTLDYT